MNLNDSCTIMWSDKYGRTIQSPASPSCILKIIKINVLCQIEGKLISNKQELVKIEKLCYFTR